MKRRLSCLLCFVALCVGAGAAKADLTELAYQVEGGILPNSSDYNWWYGCSPTSAGMMMGYYDIHGYGGLSYSNLVPGGVAEASSYGNPGAIANQAIASTAYQYDFYSAATYGTNTGGGTGYGYGVSGDDVVASPSHSFNCLADFMGTSQDSVGNSNGSTTFWYYNNGNRLHYYEVKAAGYSYWNSDGMYGIWEYVTYAGYGVADLYTQLTSNKATSGFTFADYMAEIDAGRVVMLEVTGHSMFGYGYDAATNRIIFYDTWSEGAQYMTWGGLYSGRELWGVTVMELTGGEVVPVPAAVLLGILGLGASCMKLRKFA
jgi:hypothetical protein